eukprot:CAMPEP_0184696576 /NCGR_PEP_ID=MMETSP0313-20130426/3817_1 /TAXON_ID=2792 /ORGANISM="Porphyridium aerugineum, Strain SAG 1380-2" /LENGTH=42 /DNA_ID= /DNA_START= /DNA_END= /DNA_ORIENTATION=
MILDALENEYLAKRTSIDGTGKVWSCCLENYSLRKLLDRHRR